MENRINKLLNSDKNILSIYFTAGYPEKNDTVSIIEKLVSLGVDLIEIGVPFSDSIADGPVIQHSNTVAIENGMTVKLLFEQIRGIRTKIQVPLIMMSSLNPVLRFGFENFCRQCKKVGVDGLILPDLPVEEYIDRYKWIVESYGLRNIILVTPASSDERIQMVDEHANGFIYMVSSVATTGENPNFRSDFHRFANRLSNMNLRNPLITGFGIKDKETFDQVCEFSRGGIIGTAFVKALEGAQSIDEKVDNFIKTIR